MLDLDTNRWSPLEKLMGWKYEIVVMTSAPGVALFMTWTMSYMLTQADHVSMQYYLVFDDKYISVSYLDSSEVPPHWTQLVAEYSNRSMKEAFNMKSLWYEGEKDQYNDTE
eukprot:6048773-Ditylum_brightwellii.AAC.1